MNLHTFFISVHLVYSFIIICFFVLIFPIIGPQWKILNPIDFISLIFIFYFLFFLTSLDSNPWWDETKA